MKRGREKEREGKGDERERGMKERERERRDIKAEEDPPPRQTINKSASG